MNIARAAEKGLVSTRKQTTKNLSYRVESEKDMRIYKGKQMSRISVSCGPCFVKENRKIIIFIPEKVTTVFSIDPSIIQKKKRKRNLRRIYEMKNKTKTNLFKRRLREREGGWGKS